MKDDRLVIQAQLRAAAARRIVALADTQSITLGAVQRILAEYDAQRGLP